jgi:predicted RND superfamily exporter protein
MNYLISRAVALLIAGRWPLLILALVMGALAWGPASRVHFDRSIERMFAADDPLLPPYERLKANFGGNEIVMAVYTDEHLLDPDGSGLTRLAGIGARLKAVPGVRDVLSLHEVNDVLEKLEEGKRLGSILNIFSRRKREPRWKGPAILNPKSKLSERYRDLFAGYTHSADGKTVAVVCMLEPVAHVPSAASDPRTETIEQMQAIITDLPDGLAPGVLAGDGCRRL